MIERKIIIGLITSTEYLQQISNIWDVKLIEDTTAKRIAGWAWTYFEKYGRAAGRDIETVFFEKAKNLPKIVAEEIEKDIMPSLSEEFETESFNLEYMLDETQKYFQERRLKLFAKDIQEHVEGGQIDEAEKIACDYKPVADSSETSLDMSDPIVLERIEKAFNSTSQPVINYPRQLGEFWDSYFVKGGLVMIMGSDKRGKTFFLLDAAMRACQKHKRVAFFEAGDMTESQLLKRLCVNLATKSDQQRYCEAHWEPVGDCVYNQLNNCTRKERECDFGVFEDSDKDVKYLRQEITLDELIEAYEDNKDYKPCTACDEYMRMPWGAPWIDPVPACRPLTPEEAKHEISNFFIRSKRHFKLSTYPNDTLSLKQIKAQLAIWEKQDSFVPDLIIVDYADLLITEKEMDERPKQNKIWKGLRRLSQEKGQPLVVTATQADADAYDKSLLKMSNFSEDKRKYAHITMGAALNQDPKGREKRIGLTRINILVAREGDFDIMKTITVLQNLRRGKPILGSYL
jgi:hypothetical protein